MRSLLCGGLLCLSLVFVERSSAADAVAAVTELIGRDDADFRAIGLDRIRHAAKGEEATREFADLLANLQPDRQVELLRALADRGDKAAIPAMPSSLAISRKVCSSRPSGGTIRISRCRRRRSCRVRKSSCSRSG